MHQFTPPDLKDDPVTVVPASFSFLDDNKVFDIFSFLDDADGVVTWPTSNDLLAALDDQLPTGTSTAAASTSSTAGATAPTEAGLSAVAGLSDGSLDMLFS
jgi:hypothetical protein